MNVDVLIHILHYKKYAVTLYLPVGKALEESNHKNDVNISYEMNHSYSL